MRKDAKRIKDINGMSQILIDIKPKRSLGELYIDQQMDVTELVKYIRNLKKDDNSITYFHAFMTLFAKVIANRPLLNRFVANHHVYEHNDISLSYVMKIALNDKSQELMVVMPVSDDDNLFTISKKISNKVNNIRDKKDSGTGANDAINFLGKLPNLIRIPLISLFMFCDRHGILPASLIKDNLYYSSMLVSNVGSLHCNGIYHNVTDFGTCSGIVTIGEIKEVKVKNETKYYCDLGITIDERISDGFYLIKSIHMMQYILSNPRLLEDKITEKITLPEE